MAKETTSEMLSTNNNATYKVVNGVKYFKLVSEFDGDYTKNCGLLGTEIDENFYFLRGYDIKDVHFDEDTKVLTITRVDEDYEPMEVNIGWAIANDRPTFTFDRTTGKLTVTYSDGTEVVCDGFMVEGSEDISIATDSTLRGKGTMYDPLGLAYTERTGTYAPAFDYFDISDENDPDFGKMPEGMGKGYRVVTKELFNGFGYLYPYSAVEKISQALELSEWRVPTKEDWDELLNAMECAEFRNHSSYTSTFLGQKAGMALKSPGVYQEDGQGNVVEHTGAWLKFNVPAGEDEVFGQDFKGFTTLPVGYSENRNSFMNDNDNDVEGFRKATAFWTSSVDPTNGQIYGKIFGHNTAQVYQQSFDDDSKLSIRLVKDYTLTNYEEYENILGLYYPTKLITGLYDDLQYSKIWTTINFYGDKDDLGGVGSDEWAGITSGDASTKIVYFICEWDGEKWNKKQMSEGDSVVILNKDGEENYHEWRIIHGELVDTLDQAYAEFNAEFGEIKEGLEQLSSTTIVFSSSVETILNEHTEQIEALSADVETLKGEVEALSATTEEQGEAIDALSADVETIKNDVAELSAATEEEVARIDSAMTEFRTAVAEELDDLKDRMDVVESGFTALQETVEDAVETVNEVSGTVDTLVSDLADETAAREANDLVTGDYVLDQEGTEIPTNGGDKITITVDENFFNFGEIIEGGRN